jgi:hypothetical protein
LSFPIDLAPVGTDVHGRFARRECKVGFPTSAVDPDAPLAAVQSAGDLVLAAARAGA